MRKIKGGKNTKSSRKEFKNENPYLLLDDFEQKIRNNGVWKWEHGVFGKEIVEREDEQSQKFEGKTKKDLKTAPIFCQTRVFRDWIESPQVASSKNFSKCFSRLESLPATELRAEPRKSLSNPRDWIFHSRTSHQKWPAKTRLRLATWPTRDWVAKTGQKWIFEIFKFWEQNTFQKYLKHSKIFLYLN